MRPAANRTVLDRSEWPWLGATIVAGGVIAPALLMFGLARTDGATASLLLNLEAALTAVIAWIAFREMSAGASLPACWRSWPAAWCFHGRRCRVPAASRDRCLLRGLASDGRSTITLRGASRAAMLRRSPALKG